MIYETIPQVFNPRFEVVSCFLEWNGKFVLLHRNTDKSEGGKWGVPAGKIDSGETPDEAICREVLEETGYGFSPKPFYFKKVYVKYPDYDFVYHIYHAQLQNCVEIKINPREHANAAWVLPKEALQMNLV